MRLEEGLSVLQEVIKYLRREGIAPYRIEEDITREELYKLQDNLVYGTTDAGLRDFFSSWFRSIMIEEPEKYFSFSLNQLSKEAAEEFNKILSFIYLFYCNGKFKGLYNSMIYFYRSLPKEIAQEILKVISPSWEIKKMFISGDGRSSDLRIDLLSEMASFTERNINNKEYINRWARNIEEIIYDIRNQVK